MNGIKKAGDMEEEYYFISYFASGYGSVGLYGNSSIKKTPAEWVRGTIEDEEIDDGPYIILYAEKISREMYEYFHDNI